jgi:hypothetical protein
MATKVRKRYVAKVNRAQCMEFARLCVECKDIGEVAQHARELASTIAGEGEIGTWKYYLLGFADVIERGFTSGVLPFVIFREDGNSKLPFVAFSTLPVFTCPGAGACMEYCYSLTAWRYPAAFLRQCQNTLLLRFNRRAIIEAFRKLDQGITLRLYVDGDFDSAATMLFWFNLLAQRPDVECYGYSKSWELFLNYGREFPTNYVLNVSNGSKYDGDSEMRARMLSLPITRGEFIAVRTKRKHAKGFAKYESADYHRDVRESALESGLGRVFSCPGKCGSECTRKGHACGTRREDGEFLVPITIAIGIH